MSVFNISGENIGTTQEDLETTFLELVASGEINLGAQIGATLSYNLTNAWTTNANTAYISFLTRYKQLANKAVPFFISTDQHGAGVEQHRWANNVDADGVNFANMNLGDTVTDYFNYSQLNAMMGRTKQVKNYISITGNHDALYRGDDVPTIYDLTKDFLSTYDRIVTDSHNSSYVVYDNAHDVKYVVVDNYTDVGITKETLTNNALTGELADWLIDEFARDECDIVYVQHWMLYAPSSVYAYRNGTKCTDGIGGSQTLRTLVTARKNKTSGSVTDSNGVSHSYDFSNCQHELLCALHGHQHEEMYATLDGLLCYVADWYGNNGSCVFGLIDKANGKLRIWKFDSTVTYDELVLDL